MFRWFALASLALVAVSASTSHAQCMRSGGGRSGGPGSGGGGPSFARGGPGGPGFGRGGPGGPGFAGGGPGGGGGLQMLMMQQRQQQQLMLQQQQMRQQLIAIKRKEQEVQRLTLSARNLTDSQLETAIANTQQRLERTAKLTPSLGQRTTMDKYETMQTVLANEANRRWDSETARLVFSGQGLPETQLRPQPVINVDLGFDE